MKVLVTGANGCIGKNFIELYGKKYELYEPDGDADLTQFADVRRVFAAQKYDATVHIVSPIAGDKDGLAAFRNVQYAAVAGGVKKMIVVVEAEPLSDDPAAETEDVFDAPTPLFAEDLGQYLIPKLACKDKISTVLRVYGLFGKGMSPRSEILRTLAPALIGKKPRIVLPAERAFSVVYADDVCKIIAKFLDGDCERGVYNVASPEPVTCADFAKKAKAYAKKAGRDVDVQKSSDPPRAPFTANTEKLNAALGGFKFTAFGTAVNKTLDYYAKHKSQLKEKAEEV